MKTIAQAYKDLNGDLNNTFSFDQLSDKYLFIETRGEREYICGDKDSKSDSVFQYICTVEEFNNYEEKSMKKIVRDAVIEFKGEWTNWPLGMGRELVIECINSYESVRVGELRKGHGGYDRYYLSEVCGYDEFNTYVKLLASNMGRATQTYEEYKKEYESMEVDYTSKDFWKDAPEGATHYMPNSSKWIAAWIKINGSIATHYSRDHFGTWDEFSGNRWSSELIEDGVIPRPQTKPVYTQAMCDKGELPSVGMECIAVYGKSEDKVTVAHINKKFQFACIDDRGDYFIHHPKEDINESFKPINPPIELIDGKAYQFESRIKVTLCGIYQEQFDRLNVQQGQYFDVVSVTNIKPLIVEVK